MGRGLAGERKSPAKIHSGEPRDGKEYGCATGGKAVGNKNDGLKPAVFVLVSTMAASVSDYLPKRHTRPVSIRMLFWEAPPKCV